jgi:hypothetical protein
LVRADPARRLHESSAFDAGIGRVMSIRPRVAVEFDVAAHEPAQA